MTEFSIICKDTWRILEIIKASNPSIAKSIATSLYPDKNIEVCYNEPCLTAD